MDFLAVTGVEVSKLRSNNSDSQEEVGSVVDEAEVIYPQDPQIKY